MSYWHGGGRRVTRSNAACGKTLRCGALGHDKLLAFSCKRRGFCLSCGARRMAKTAAQLADHVFPHLPAHLQQIDRQEPAVAGIGLRCNPGLRIPLLRTLSVECPLRRELAGSHRLKAVVEISSLFAGNQPLVLRGK